MATLALPCWTVIVTCSRKREHGTRREQDTRRPACLAIVLENWQLLTGAPCVRRLTEPDSGTIIVKLMRKAALRPIPASEKQKPVIHWDRFAVFGGVIA